MLRASWARRLMKGDAGELSLLYALSMGGHVTTHEGWVRRFLVFSWPQTPAGV